MTQYFLACMGFGGLMGIVFSPFAFLFVQRPGGWAEWIFRSACILAGLMVGLIAYLLGKKMLLGFLKEPIGDIQRLFEESGSNRSSSGRQDVLVRMRLDLEEACGYMVESAGLSRRTEEGIRQLNLDFTAALKNIEQSAEENRRIASENDGELKRFQEILNALVTVFHRQDEITDRVQERISELRRVLSSLALEIRKTSDENESCFKAILDESDRFLGAVQSLTDASDLIGRLAGEMHRLADNVSTTSVDLEEIAEITEQTRILAVNANIEAARAGNAVGRGFRIIAGTVSDLADRSGKVSEGILADLEELKRSSLSVAEAADEQENRLTAHRNEGEQARAAREQIHQDLERSREMDKRVIDALESQETEMDKLLENAETMSSNETNLVASIRNLQEGFSGLSERSAAMKGISGRQIDSVSSVRGLHGELAGLADESAALAGRFRTSGEFQRRR